MLREIIAVYSDKKHSKTSQIKSSGKNAEFFNVKMGDIYM